MFVEIKVNVSDVDDPVVGEIDFGDSEKDVIINGINTFNHEYKSPGSIPITVTGSSLGSGEKRIMTNIIIMDTTSDGIYYAACVEEPADLSNIPESRVHFKASTTKVINYTVSAGKQVIDLKDLKFNWTFKGGYSCVFQDDDRICFDSQGNYQYYSDTCTKECVYGWDFYYEYPSSGENWAIVGIGL